MNDPVRIVIVGAGVAGSEMGTYLGQQAKSRVEIIEIDQAPDRCYGGWGFQGFPEGVTTNLALRKMYLGDDPQEILRWANDPAARERWPEDLRGVELHPSKPFPRGLMREYVKWRRSQVANPFVTYTRITGEAVKVSVLDGLPIVTLASGEIVEGDRLVLASGSITVKVPDYLQKFSGHPNVILDPLTLRDHERRMEIPTSSRVLILGVGLTGEEQAIVLLNRGLQNLTFYSRNGKMHYAYPEFQDPSEPLVLNDQTDFLFAETPEEFSQQFRQFCQGYLARGYTFEKILAAIRHNGWDDIRKRLGGCMKAAARLRQFKRELAVSSIGTTYEVSKVLNAAMKDGHLHLVSGAIESIARVDDAFQVTFQITDGEGSRTEIRKFDWILNGVGRNILRHPLWEDLLASGLAKKHASIGVQVNEHGQMLSADDCVSGIIWVVGMPRAGDHALRRGYLGNLAFNVPQVRAHVYSTGAALLGSL